MAEYGVSALNLNLTSGLCSFLSNIEFGNLPNQVVHAARRGVLDWVGCALVGSSHPTVGKMVKVLETASDTRRATVLGRYIRLSAFEAALANGLAGHVLDYDDTHMQGVILHTSSPVLAALLALAETRPVSGREFVAAYVAGFEAGVRVGKAAPGHHRGGWHLTGTLGSIAAAAACGRLLKLTPTQLTRAVGIGATQAAGMQQNRGTMSKSLHAGKAAQNGLLAALLAEAGFDSSLESIEGRKGFCRIYSDVAAPEALIEGLGVDWEISDNGYKPYACGVVMHPAIDVMIGLRNISEADPRAVEKIELVVNPIAVTVTGVRDPRSGLQSKFSLRHSAAVAFLDRAAGVAQYTDQRATADDVQTLGAHVTITTDPSYRTDQASARMNSQDRSFSFEVDHATGTKDNPMSDAVLEHKFLTNAGSVLSEERALSLLDQLWRVDEIDDISAIPRLCCPPKSSLGSRL